MTDETRKEEIAANWQRALESARVAEELLRGHHPDIAASRAYYAAHYASVALLLSREAIR